MSDALERLLLTGGVPALARQRERIDGGMQGLDGRVEALERERRSGFEKVLATVEGEIRTLPKESVRETQVWDRSAAQAEVRQPKQGGGYTTLPGATRLQPTTGRRRDDPLVLTEEPLPDDEEFYGPAWPLIVEWRQLRASHPYQGKGLSWLIDEECLMEVEVPLLEDHGFTLPPRRMGR